MQRCAREEPAESSLRVTTAISTEPAVLSSGSGTKDGVVFEGKMKSAIRALEPQGRVGPAPGGRAANATTAEAGRDGTVGAGAGVERDGAAGMFAGMTA
ncbi:MAG: hypothetical protein B9S34_07795 [Opitutia bacterium Tous-C1TDCM]|nr:MAG: hypothetical protein B9S34_07795 [Opitutae bacterium Tous-C1TDCM]